MATERKRPPNRQAILRGRILSKAGVKQAKPEPKKPRKTPYRNSRTTLDQWKAAVLALYPGVGWLHETSTMLRNGGYAPGYSASGKVFWACIGPPEMKVVGVWIDEEHWRVAQPVV